ncbi:ABC transporter substrate-binding protein [Sulfitobacter mediterraneus]|uniref:ABC transporter substrate-binding protein n=1 Tax=Sulfitobacter mediterraneus TaxID=83219 RepID=UPI00193A5BB2|nr:ABC transporter substrate-binding protein [Sulfitobacter mediterraneus]MBM1557581.1 ABC transporter substrate-binding protein [Sulfitobacter mediterraneus]MBM1569310.1 ABC transporter substrate-binding protein [Sulfitobacter mediterraneus]MBM1572754.1 ABC transporter substrate-binding protein [Sulfitobacter mediterraneus]MBM1576917.1 ABC transporter substrate-binding protein [Sulfitobacter mediterraneus]MBM1580583.1 ABC transporter substrate-binding protein [Sulfitobacter mediterraneus]
MITFNRRQTLATMGAAAAVGLAAPAIAQNKKIVVGALRFTSHSGSFVAFERDYFKEAGLDVELRFFQAAQPMAVAIASGDVDYAVTAISGGLVSLAQKGAIKVIGGALQEEAGIDGQKFLVSDAAYQAGVTTPAMLDGKSYGITQAGSSFHYMGSKMAAAEGINLTFKPLQKVGAIIGALKSGQIDAWSIVPHIAKPLSGSGAVHIIGDVADYLPDYQVTTVFTSAKNASDDRDLTQGFLGGFSKGVADYNSAMIAKDGGEDGVNAMVDLIHKYVYTDRPREKAAPSIINGTMRLNEGAALNVASVADQLSWFQSEGLVDADITLDQLIDTSYVKTMGA